MSAREVDVDADIERSHKPMFTFTTSSQKPTFKVRCQHCCWRAQGELRRVGGDWVNPVFPQADEHICPLGTAAERRTEQP